MFSSQIFVPDDRYDYEHASDFQSRYGAYLRSNTGQFLDYETNRLTDNPVDFAAAAWRIAQSPVMSPAYVMAHPRVLSATASWDLEYRLAITVAVAAGVPHEISRALRGVWRGWNRSGVWSEPEDNDLPVATTVLRLRVPITADGLPTPVYSSIAEPSTEVAKAAVQTICGRLNAALTSVFSRLDRKEVA
ncbi:hypothetical protein MOQ72_29270 [Saccharopolyspora sp. K220]|uniref:hypothetical protein n=1 Tax=Saccharopolyspora soli TaxID=2926618 RepID=UPI001F5785E4|nr:hypothetical protein [Saccharopolyspora soli]MCI2421533.1 hypothetical protein [Saccharopolyspora soli]